MLKFDFTTYMNYHVNIDSIQKQTIIESLKNNEMAGFFNNVINEESMTKIKNVAKQIRNNCDVFIVIGIGGSFMASYAIKNMFFSHIKKSTPEVIYLGTDLSSKYLLEVFDYIKDKDVVVNVISKSGTTLEINLIYNAIKEELQKKYSQEELRKRIIITTDIDKGKLREEANKEGYTSFVIPTDIGGRYSLMTPAHLLPLAVMNLDIDSLLEGYKLGLSQIDDAYHYASLRIELFKNKKYIENFSVYEPSLYYYTEWIKQLFGESEGKDGKGIFPVSTVNTRDLHSLGQFIQQGNNILFETVIEVLNTKDVKIGKQSLNNVNHLVREAVCVAHAKDNTPSIVISMDNIDMKNIGNLSAFLMLSAVFSSYLFEVNPFNQPGVETYKSEIKKRVQI